MKELIKNATTILLITLLFAALPTDAEGEIYEDTVRLHILANSDSDEDQQLKLEVRDYILAEYGPRLGSQGNIDQAKAEIESLLDEIRDFAKRKVAELGYSYDVRAVMDNEWYETREYEGFSLPAGYYCSLKIIIGEGNGKNWWCVMYPPLCTEIATEAAPADDGLIDYSKEEILLIKSGKYNIKFKILEDLSKLFTKSS